MEMQPFILNPENLAELNDYAKRHKQDTATALNAALADYFAWEKQDHAEAVEGIRAGYEDKIAGRTQPLDDFFEDLRVEHGFPR